MENIQDIKTVDAEQYQLIKAEPKFYAYGTAGFRYKADVMKPISFRVGLFMDYIAKYYFPHAVGIIITASHNPMEDNGLKLVNPEGEIMDIHFEPILEKLVNTEDLEAALEGMRSSLATVFAGKTRSEHGLIFIGRDTRKSGEEILGLMTKFNTSTTLDLGQLSTPIVYYLVAYYNEHRDQFPQTPTSSILGVYFKTLADGFAYHMKRHFKKQRFNLVVDCSNGIGSIMIEKFRETDLFKRYNAHLIHNTEFDKLNFECGAESAHKTGKASPRFLAIPEEENLPNLCLALDGDADRSLFYLRTQKGGDDIKIGDGNRVCILYTKTIVHLKNQIAAHKEKYDSHLVEELINSTIGVVYTSSSNNAFVDYATQVLKVGAGMARTGVKYVHKKAQEYDIGIYFESNGHGTIIFKHHICDLLHKLKASAKDEAAAELVEDLHVYLTAQNHVNGDALANIFLILASLEILNIDIQEMYTCYTDNNNRSSKVPLKDRTLMKSCQVDERVLAQPAEIQPQIDELMKSHPGYIAFVRPSGTEDICRTYVEGKDENVLKELEGKLKKIVSEHPSLRLS